MGDLTGNRFGGARLGLAVLCVAQFVVVLDATIVATALPVIGAELHFSPTGLGWVMNAYTVVMAGLLILGGRVADLFGARRIFVAGLVTFTAASLGCAFAWSPGALIGARIAQGVGAALLSPAALAALHHLVDEPAARRRALGWWTAAAAGGGASGWMLGGLLMQLAGWRWIFAINAPVGIAALLVARRALAGAAGRDPAAPRRLDLPGAATVTAGIGVLTLGLTELGADPRRFIGWLALLGAVLLLAGFVVLERRSEQPLVPPSLLRVPGVVGGNLTAVTLTASTTSAMLTAVFYVHDSLGLPPAAGALLFPAFNIAVIGGSVVGPRLLGRLNTRIVLLSGFITIGVGVGLLFLLAPQGPLGVLVAAFLVMGSGLGAASVASTAAGTTCLTAADRGVGSGLLNSTAQLGNAIGLAVTAPVIASTEAMTGYRLGFSVAAVVALSGVLAAYTVPRGSAWRQPSPRSERDQIRGSRT